MTKPSTKATAAPIKAVGYIRVSTQEQAIEGVSLDEQRRKIEAYAAFRDLDLVEIVVDAGVSAAKPMASRVGGARLLQLARPPGECQAVIACKLDRLFRDASDCLEVTRHWDAAGVGLHLLDMGMDTSTPMGRAFLTMAAAFAELERNLVSVRTRDGLAEVFRQGGRNGRPAYGWRWSDEDGPDGRRVQEEVAEEQMVIEVIRERRAEGLSLKAIAQELNEAGVSTQMGKPWIGATVNSILKRVSEG